MHLEKPSNMYETVYHTIFTYYLERDNENSWNFVYITLWTLKNKRHHPVSAAPHSFEIK